MEARLCNTHAVNRTVKAIAIDRLTNMGVPENKVYHGLPYGLPWFTIWFTMVYLMVYHGLPWFNDSFKVVLPRSTFFSWPDQCSGPHRQMCSKHFDKNMLHQFQNLRPKVGSEQMWRVGDANALSFAAFRHIISRFSLSLSIPEVSVSLVCSTSSR